MVLRFAGYHEAENGNAGLKAFRSSSVSGLVACDVGFEGTTLRGATCAFRIVCARAAKSAIPAPFLIPTPRDAAPPLRVTTVHASPKLMSPEPGFGVRHEHKAHGDTHSLSFRSNEGG